MNIQEAAKTLHKQLTENVGNGHFSVGNGVDNLFVYVHHQTNKNTSIPESWEGYKVEVRKIGKIQAIEG